MGGGLGDGLQSLCGGELAKRFHLGVTCFGAAEEASHDDEAESPPTDEVGIVTTKIDRLGRQMRDVKDVFSALKDNVDQIMANLQDGLMLFTHDTRVVLVSAAVERFLGKPRSEIGGQGALARAAFAGCDGDDDHG